MDLSCSNITVKHGTAEDFIDGFGLVRVSTGTAIMDVVY